MQKLTLVFICFSLLVAGSASAKNKKQNRKVASESSITGVQIAFSKVKNSEDYKELFDALKDALKPKEIMDEGNGPHCEPVADAQSAGVLALKLTAGKWAKKKKNANVIRFMDDCNAGNAVESTGVQIAFSNLENSADKAVLLEKLKKASKSGDLIDEGNGTHCEPVANTQAALVLAKQLGIGTWAQEKTTGVIRLVNDCENMDVLYRD